MDARETRAWRIWPRLIAPAAHITDVDDRRSAELLARLILVLAALSLIATSIAYALDPRLATERLPVICALEVLYLVLFALNRTRLHRVAAFLFCIGPIASDVVIGLQEPSDPIWYAFIPLSTILASAFLTFRGAVIVGLLSVAGTLGVVVGRHDVYGGRGVLILAAVLIANGVILGMARFRARVERERQEELTRLAEQLAANARLESVGRLAGGVAHDFNNLLTVIFASTELARRGRDVPQMLDEIMSSAERAAALTNQLLAFSRSQATAPSVLSLDAVVDDLRSLLRRLLPEHIDVGLALGARWHVRADRRQIEQVLLNLAANARDAMPQGGRIQLATRDVDVGTPGALLEVDHVLVTVTDDGVGMDEATRRRAFEPFFTTKSLGRGTGLGLASVHGIVQQSGGRVALASRPGVGTEVSIAFPRTTEAPPGPAVERARQPARLSGLALLVEDEAHVRRSVEQVLGSIGLRVVTAASAAEVPRALAEAEGPIDLLVTDVVMPGKSGAALSAELRLALPDLPVILMSGYAEEELAAVLALPNTRFVPKPFTSAALTEAVADLLASKAALIATTPGGR